jgi:Na+/H+-dicarboxylate symporter
MSDSGRALAALALGIVLGFLTSVFAAPIAVVLANFVEPAGTLWFNAIRMSVIPLIVACVFSAVVQSKDFGAFGRAGTLVFAAAIAFLGVAALASLALGPLVLEMTPIDPRSLDNLRQHYAAASAPGISPVTSVGESLGQLFPTNLFKALADGALLPITLATLAFAASARHLIGSRKQLMKGLADGVAEMSFTWIRWMIRVAPIGIFALVFALTVRTGQAVVLALAYYVVLTAILCFAVAAALYLLVWSTRVVSLPLFSRAAFAPQGLGFSSRSSMAALPLMVEAARDRLRLPDEVSQGLLPLLVSVFRVTGSIVICIAAVFVAWLYGITLQPDHLLVIAFFSVLLGMAMPGIPGGGVLASGPVLAAAGLPAEAIPMLLAVDAAGDMLRTATNVTGHLALSVFAARVLSWRQRPRFDEEGAEK